VRCAKVIASAAKTGFDSAPSPDDPAAAVAGEFIDAQSAL
jgi:hypothetical protein